MNMPLTPLKRVASINAASLDETTSPERVVTYADISDVSQGKPVRWQDPMVFSDAPSRARRLVFHNDTLMSTVRTYLRAVTRVDDPPANAVVSTGFAVIRPNSIDARFLGYALQSDTFIDEVVARSVGVSYPAISPLDVGAIKVPVPDQSEQAAIADFLDHETAEIDAFLTDLWLARDLADERHQVRLLRTLTGHASHQTLVTTPGAGWFEEIPAGWTAQKIRRLTPVARGASPRPIDDPKYFNSDGNYAWTRIADVTASDGRLTATPQKLSDLGAALSVRLDPGDLFVSIAGSVGKPCITEIPACIHDGFVYFPKIGPYAEWLYHVFAAGYCYRGLGKLGTQLNLNTATVGDIVVPVPPEEELPNLLDAIADEVNEHRQRCQDIDLAISLSRERRAALISAAVTGQMDVTKRHRPVVERLEEEVLQNV